MQIEIRVLNNKDLKVIMEYLNRNPIETAFLYGNVKNFGVDNDRNIRRCGDYYGYFEEGILRGILPFYNLGSCIPHFESEMAISIFSEIMKGRDFKFLLNMSSIIDPIYNYIKDSKNTINISDDSYFINEKLISFKLAGVEIKSLYEISLDKAIDFRVETLSKGFEQAITRENVKKSLLEMPKEDEMLFLFKNNEIVSTACIQTSTKSIGQIGGVYTKEECRGNGYCKAIISEICKRTINKNKIPTLMVRKNNVSAVKAYSALGFKYYEDYKIIEFK